MPGQQLLDLLGQRTDRPRRLLLQLVQAVEALEQPLALVYAAHMRRAGRNAEQPQLQTDTDGGVGREIQRHLEDPFVQLIGVSFGIRGRRRAAGASPSRPYFSNAVLISEKLLQMIPAAWQVWLIFRSAPASAHLSTRAEISFSRVSMGYPWSNSRRLDTSSLSSAESHGDAVFFPGFPEISRRVHLEGEECSGFLSTVSGHSFEASLEGVSSKSWTV